MLTEQENEKNELIVVFKKDVTPDDAESMLKTAGIPKYREGMDSSRGKIYFYSTGPKFILTFDSPEEKEKFMSANKGRDKIHEIYTPDWTKRKD